MTLVRLVRFWPDHFSAIKQSLMHASLVRVKERVLTEHLLAERCLLTVQLNFFFALHGLHIRSRTTLELLPLLLVHNKFMR